MKTRNPVLFLAAFLFSTSFSHAQDLHDAGTVGNRIDEFVGYMMSTYQIPGVTLAIVKDNQIYMTRAYGVKNLDTKDPVTAGSVFHMASVSKPFAATAVMQLVEKGKMHLEDPLVQYLPYFKLDDPRCKEITIKQMLTHISGIPDVRDYEWDNPQYDDGAAERYVRSLGNEKMIGGPGERFRYSNMAFDILADVIAKVSGMTFEDYIKKNILDPLEMNNSDFLRKRIRQELRTSPHVFNLQPQVSEVYPYNRYHAPSSCLNANVVDMCNWAMANMNKGAFKGRRILKESSYNLLFEPQVTIGPNQSVGLSWFLGEHRGMKTVSHSGGDLGYRSYIVMFPEESLAFILASNYSGTPMGSLTFGVVDIMLGYEPPNPRIPVSIVLAKTILTDGTAKAIAQYRELKANGDSVYNFGESQLNNLGYELLSLDRVNDAIEIFKLNVEMYPKAYNPYDSLGEAYLKAGNKELAVKNYEKSLQLNPENRNAEDVLKQIRADR